MKKAWRKSSKLKTRKNGAQKLEVRERISSTVAQRWADGLYNDRVNGMLGKSSLDHPNYLGGSRQYRNIALSFHPKECWVKDCQMDQSKIDIHHVDENRDNFLLTNLMPLCVGHHLWENHYERKKAPFMSLYKHYELEAAHVLPWHAGKCRRPHGHTYKFEVWVERRMGEQGIVVDFGDISTIVRTQIVDRFDHQNLNDFFPNPTAENILLEFWSILSRDLKGMRKARLWETSNSYAEVTVEQLLRSYAWTQTPDGWKFVKRIP